jgi:hypothetical protein
MVEDVPTITYVHFCGTVALNGPFFFYFLAMQVDFVLCFENKISYFLRIFGDFYIKKKLYLEKKY